MDMSSGMPGGYVGMDGTYVPLNDSGVDFSNETQAFNFLQLILDDTDWQVIGNYHARNFWYGVCVVVGIAAIFNWIQVLDMKLRIRAAATNWPQPAMPRSLASLAIATTTAIFREASYMQLPPFTKVSWFKVPPMGTIILLVAYLCFVLGLEFTENDYPGAQHYTALGVRAAWLAVAQMPLIILLAGKNNLIGLLTGTSYERLNVLHRWVARMMLLLATLHMGYQNYGWDQYGLRILEWQTDTCPPTGIATYAILLWLNISTLAPFRHFSYEFFVVQHLITFFGFIIAIMWHIPSTALYARAYIYIPIALYCIDRIIRSLRYAYHNMRPARATMTALQGGVTKIRLHSKQMSKWTPGQHVLLSIPRFGPGQSHPATIASIPASHNGDLIFILKGHKGFTNRIMKSAYSSTANLISSKEGQDPASSLELISHIALIDGPYGGSHADFAGFDSVCLIAGSTGVTFMLPILLDLAYRSSNQKLPLRRLEFIWCIKSSTCVSWVSEELRSAFGDLHNAGVDVALKIFITCDDSVSGSSANSIKGCQCKKEGPDAPCCCTRTTATTTVVTSDDAIRSTSEAGTEVTSTPEKTATISSSSSISSKPQLSQILPFATFTPTRPSIPALLTALLESADGESGIACCGPLGLSTSVRNEVVRLSDERAVHKGSGAQGVYLHVEGFCW
ncbi:MAG: hypothetical protein MMC33_005175 [Icmadophila ericetorum]|nr:hypothetical protein [Icmadophila ericetorum]